MTRIKTVTTSSLLILTLTLTVMLTTLATSNVQPVQANAADQITSSIQEDVFYLPLTDAPPLRDITQQRFAPLEIVQ